MIYRMFWAFFKLWYAYIYFLLRMDGKSWKDEPPTDREPETVALRHLSSHFNIALTLTAAPLSAQQDGLFLLLPPNPAFLLIWDFRNDCSPSMLLGYGKPLPGCVKGTTLQPCSLRYSIPVFKMITGNVCIAVGYIISLLCFASFLFLIMSLLLCFISVQSDACPLQCCNLNRENISGLYVSRQSEQRRTQMLATTAFCVSCGTFIWIYSFMLV